MLVGFKQPLLPLWCGPQMRGGSGERSCPNVSRAVERYDICKACYSVIR
jgi:hypothetical protein